MFGYAASINYFPDLDLGTSAALFATIALFGAFVLALLAVIFVAPGFMWVQMTSRSSGLTRLVLGAPHAFRRPVWFGAPLAALLIAAGIVSAYVDGKSAQWWWLIGIWLGLSVVTGLASRPAAVVLARARVPEFARWRPHPPRTAERRKARYRHHARLATRLAANFGLASLVSAPMIAVSLTWLFRFAPPIRPGATWSDPAVRTTLFLILAVSALNALLVLEPRPARSRQPQTAAPQQWYALDALRWRVLVAATSVFVVLTLFGQWHFVAGRLMWRFGLGAIEKASLVLDKSGCAVARAIGLDPLPVRESDVCRVDGVTIDLRVGTTYVLRVPGATSEMARRRFVLSRDRVLSPISPPDTVVPDSVAAR